MIWSRIVDKTPSVDVDRFAEVTRRALSDKKTRDAFAQTVAQGRATYARFAQEDAKSGLAKLARDAKAQEDVGALVRSVAQTIDTSLTRRSNRSLLRRIGILSAVAVCIGAVVGRRRRRGTAPIVVVQESTDAVVEPLNGATATPERSIRI
jgi:hypothetical protein